jgi:hypothetical protein
LSPAAPDSAIRLLDQPPSRKTLGDMVETALELEGKINGQNNLTGGEAGIRTLGRSFSPYNGLANRRLQPLGHLTAARNLSIRQASSYGNTAVAQIVPEIVPASTQKRRRRGACAQKRKPNATVLFADNYAGN